MRVEKKLQRAIGVDIEEIGRFKKGIRNRNFRARVFSSSEISYYESTGKRPESLAGMFAAKEATIKALAQLLQENCSIDCLEIIHNSSGVPSVEFKPASNLESEKRIRFSLSISHSGALAVAIVLAERKG